MVANPNEWLIWWNVTAVLKLKWEWFRKIILSRIKQVFTENLFLLDHVSSIVDFTLEKEVHGPPSGAYSSVGDSRWTARYRLLADDVPQEEWQRKTT